MSRPLIIGAGHNGLVAAFYLAKAGLQPIVLEARDDVGGGAITRDILPGFHCPTLTHETPVHARIVADMDLRRHGAEFLAVDVDVCAPATDGPPLVLHVNDARSVASIRTLSEKDAAAYPAWRAAIASASSVLSRLLTAPAPDIDKPGVADMWNLLKAGRAFRALGDRDAYRLLRWLPMPVADLVGEWFENERLRATLAGPAVSGTMLGPWSGGSALVLLLREAHRHLSGGTPLRARGGPGALTRAMANAAMAAGAEVRTGARVERIVVRHERVEAVVVNGQEIPASAVLSSADPKSTFLSLVDPADLTPTFLGRLRNYRAQGTLAKVNLALTALPSFAGVGDPQLLSGRIHIGPEIDYLERAFDQVKYGKWSPHPWLDITIPSILDPDLAPAGAHVASIYVHDAPHRLRRDGDQAWDTERPKLLAAVIETLERYAPGVSALVAAAETITPADLERDYSLSGGHIFHGELALDQLFSMRPVIGHGQYDSPIAGLFLCGAGTHPGGFMTGESGRRGAEAMRGQRGKVKGQR